MKKRFLCLLGCALSITATAYEPVWDLRRVDVFSSGGNSTAEPGTPFSTFQVAGQNTEFYSDGFGGTMSGFGESDVDFFVRQSVFDVTFELLQAEPFEIIGLATGNAGNFGLAVARVRLFEGDQIDADRLVFGWSLTADTSDDVTDAIDDFAELLPPGVYRLVIQTDITPGGFDTYMDISFGVLLPGPQDSDGDGIANNLDNCSGVANVDQLDGDSDGYGNRCDADFNNDCIVNAIDLGLMRVAFFAADDTVDLNGDGVVNFVDLGLLRAAFFREPGPSGLTDQCAPG